MQIPLAIENIFKPSWICFLEKLLFLKKRSHISVHLTVGSLAVSLNNVDS